MTSKAPMTGLVTDSAETLARALFDHENFGKVGPPSKATLWISYREKYLRVAQALITSGAVRPAAEVRAEMAGVLAGDETLVEAGARAFYEGFDSNPHHRRQWPAPKQHIPWWMARARDVISAVAAALAEEGGDRG